MTITVLTDNINRMISHGNDVLAQYTLITVERSFIDRTTKNKKELALRYALTLRDVFDLNLILFFVEQYFSDVELDFVEKTFNDLGIM